MNNAISTDLLTFDLAIIGGGPVGASLALALRDSGLKICILEARSNQTTSNDARALALSYGSRLLLERIGVWNVLQDVTPIRTIHISQRQSFGRALLRAAELQVPEFGYVLPYSMLQDTLDSAVQRSGITAIYGANVTRLAGETDCATLEYRLTCSETAATSELTYTLRTRLAVVADGGKLLAHQFPPELRDYGQSALIAHLTCSQQQIDMAYERFTAQGPVALLPFQQGYELVWTAPHLLAQEMLDWEEAKFLSELQHHFGDRVGNFLTVGNRNCFPLGLRRAPNLSPMPHTVLLGNAAQTMHPVAGQGFNMGLRDAWELAQEIINTATEALGTNSMLTQYRNHRRTDREAGIRFTDGLVRLFSNNLPLVSATRAAALSALDCLPFAKRFVARRMMFGANG